MEAVVALVATADRRACASAPVSGRDRRGGFDTDGTSATPDCRGAQASAEEAVEVVKLTPRERVQQRTAEWNEDVPAILLLL